MFTKETKSYKQRFTSEHQYESKATLFKINQHGAMYPYTSPSIEMVTHSFRWKNANMLCRKAIVPSDVRHAQ